MVWTTEQAYPISLDVVLSVNLTTILLYYTILFYFILYVCMYLSKIKTCNPLTCTFECSSVQIQCYNSAQQL